MEFIIIKLLNNVFKFLKIIVFYIKKNLSMHKILVWYL